MNWGIRIAAIVVILGGLLWLNWDRFAEQLSPIAIPEEEHVDAEDPQNPSSQEIAQEDSIELQDTLVAHPESDASVSRLPDFELQEAPASLDTSDKPVRDVVEELSPPAVEWLGPEEQLRKWTLLVKQAAEGKILYQDRPFILNLPEFAVEERGERYFISPQNFARYDPVVKVLASLPAEKLVAYYRSWYPLLEQAFGELGLPGSFDEKVDAVIERILVVEVLETPIELKKPSSVTYKFLDPELESASQIDKWLWRMGPENTRKIQDLAERLKRALEKSS